jgi:hypothetical protein
MLVDFVMKCISITDFHYTKISYVIPTRIEIIHGSHSLYPVLTWVTLCSLHFIPRDKRFTKIMLPMLKLDTNSGFHKLFLNYTLQ